MKLYTFVQGIVGLNLMASSRIKSFDRARRQDEEFKEGPNNSS
jgi:hypothetical protein